EGQLAAAAFLRGALGVGGAGAVDAAGDRGAEDAGGQADAADLHAARVARAPRVPAFVVGGAAGELDEEAPAAGLALRSVAALVQGRARARRRVGGRRELAGVDARRDL